MSGAGFRVIALAAVGGLLVGFLDSVIDYFVFYDEPFSDLLVHRVPAFEVYFRSTIFAIFLAYGFVTARMVTRRERLADQLRAGRENLQLLFGALSDFLMVLDAEGRLLEVNPAVTATLGVEREQLLGSPWCALLDRQTGEDGGVADPALALGTRQTCDLVFVDRDGRPIHVEAKVSRGTWDGRQVRFLVGRDVTEKIAAERALRESEAKYGTLVENSLTGIFIHQGGRIVFANSTMTELFGYTQAQLEGMDPLELVHPEDRPRAARRVAQRLAGEEVRPEHEIRCVRASGEMIYVTMRAVRIEYLGRPAILGNVADSTERKRVEQALTESQEEVRRLSARMLYAQEVERGRMARELHDGVGQSLSAIKYFVESALRRGEGGVGESAATILRALVPKVQETVEEVRRLSMDLRPSSLDDLGLLPTLGWFCREFQALHPDIDVVRHTDISEQDVPQPLKIVIYRIAQEALNNAAKHSGAPRVSIGLSRVEERLELVVEDQGRGFDLAKVRTDLPDRGFGLSSMRERAELSGGALSIRSAEGAGTVVRVAWAFPRRHESAAM